MDENSYINGYIFKNRIFVGGLPKNTSAFNVAKYFERFGEVLDSKVVISGGVSKGYGFVTFRREEHVHAIMNALPLYYANRQLNIGPAIRIQVPDDHGESVHEMASIRHFSQVRPFYGQPMPCGVTRFGTNCYF
ncbi:protein boule-like [Hydra vulgaris]|uniref:Protein boule-like n=1 Tax=Hydra vulgaris TaxID=6087 RepID=A0ABM4BAH7_HYDVU